MDIHYISQNTQFVWNHEKATTNFNKHHISFETASEAFFDPFFHIIDSEIIDNEERESLIGMTMGWQLLYVVYTIRNETIRIISARLTTKHERRTYEEQ